MQLTLSARVFAFIAKPQNLRQVRKENFSTLNASSTPSYWERLNQPKSVMAPMVAQSGPFGVWYFNRVEIVCLSVSDHFAITFQQICPSESFVVNTILTCALLK